MSFFNSEMVQQEIEEISELQEQVYENIFHFATMSKEEKMNHLENLQQLLEKQRILYTRLSLSDEPEAKEMKARILDSAYALGLPVGMDINLLFNDVYRVIESLQKKVDKGTEI